MNLKLFYKKNDADNISSSGICSTVDRMSAQRLGGTGFETGFPKDGVRSSCSPLGTQISRVGLGLVSPVSGIM